MEKVHSLYDMIIRAESAQRKNHRKQTFFLEKCLTFTTFTRRSHTSYDIKSTLNKPAGNTCCRDFSTQPIMFYSIK